MTAPGPKPRPQLQVVREGNPGKRPVRERVQLKPSAPREPSWQRWFPTLPRLNREKATDDQVAEYEIALEANKMARARAREEWRRVVPVLDAQGLLAVVDAEVLADYCVVVARIEECERMLSRLGLAVMGERGWMKNPAATAANQYRAQLKAYIGELGLSPASRIAAGPGDDGDDDAFD